MTAPKLTAIAACRVAGWDRDRFNEHVAAGRFPCAPATVAGRARLFDPDDMIALWLFRQLMLDGFDATSAGRIACAVSNAARENPNARAISYLRTTAVGNGGFTLDGLAIPAAQVPDPEGWNRKPFEGELIERVMTFNIWQMRQRIAHLTEEQREIIGPED